MAYVRDKAHHATVMRAWHKKMPKARRDRYAAKNKLWRAENKEHLAITARAWTDANLSQHLCVAARYRAKKLGIEFNLTPEDCQIPERCPVFGIKLHRGTGKSCPSSPTIDRVDASKGYVRGNIAVISQFANSLKGKATAAQHHRIAEWMETL